MRHYGHAGPRYIDALLADRDRWSTMRNEHRALQAAYLGRAGGPGADRLAEYAASISVAGRLAHEYLRLPWAFTDPFDALWPSVAAGTDDAAGHLRALQDVMSAYAGQVSRFWATADTDRPAPARGWLGERRDDGAIAWLNTEIQAAAPRSRLSA